MNAACLGWCAALALAAGTGLCGVPETRDGGWKLIWHDEFNGPTLNTNVWTAKIGLRDDFKREAYTDRPENVRCENGSLVIETRREAYGANVDYTAAWLSTARKFEFRYGRLEARARVPVCRGIWAAIWTIGKYGDLPGWDWKWPRCGEVDILEYVGFETNYMWGTVHYRAAGKVKENGHASYGKTVWSARPYNGFHDYAMEWDADAIRLFYDGKNYMTFPVAKADFSGTNGFRTPHFLIVNSGVGGVWGGVKGIDDAALPAKFEVDYIRVYQREEPALVPAPKKMRMTGGSVAVTRAALDAAVADWHRDDSLTNEGYRLSVATNGISVVARDAAGAFYAGRTLRQMARFADAAATTGTVLCAEIDDAPHFPWRGLHLDASRHFFGVGTVKRLLDRMANLKLNVFHWHLTDGGGWRLPSRRFPKLNGRAARTRPVRHTSAFRDLADSGDYGPHAYTEDEIREVVAYAAARHIRVVPEVEMPGHAAALLRAYPELACFPNGRGAPTNAVDGVVCAGNPAATALLEGVLDEVCELFPGEIIHIGGDEVPKANWTACPRCRARMAREGLKDGVELENRMMRHFAAYLQKKGRRAILWEEAFDGGGFDASSRAIVMSWNGYDYARRAAAAGFDAVVCPTWVCYFDYPQGLANDPAAYPKWAKNPVRLETVYRFNPAGPIPAANRAHVLGGQGNNWTECTCTEAELMHKAFPRAEALAEALWSAPPWPRDTDDFRRRLDARCAVPE